MKKTLLTVAALAATLSLTGCGGSSHTARGVRDDAYAAKREVQKDTQKLENAASRGYNRIKHGVKKVEGAVVAGTEDMRDGFHEPEKYV